MNFQKKEAYRVGDLLAIIELLRSPGGCPWDREQDHHSIRRNLIEETYEVVEAIDRDDPVLLKEELGDLLLQVVLHTRMEEERSVFRFDDVCDGICKKLIARHPHIFSDAIAETSAQVLESWEAIKKEEKKHKTAYEAAADVPRVLPSLIRSEKVQSRVARSGFDYEDTSAAMNDLRSEVRELEAAMASGSREAVYEELGDLLFSVVNVARFQGIDAEKSLGDSCDKFLGRFCRVEALAAEREVDMTQAGPQLLDSLWLEAKNKEQ